MRVIERDIVGAFIFSNDGYLLFGKSNRGTYEGCWIIPGGGIESGESKLEAIIREVSEEVGLDIANEKSELLSEVLTGESPKLLKETGEMVLGKYRFFNFIVRIDKKHQDIKVSSNDDFEDAMWHSLSTLKDLKLPPPSIATLKLLGYL